MNCAAQAGGERKGVIDIEALWNDFHERVCHWLYGLVGNWEDAEDMTICVFAQAWKRRDGYDPSKSSLCTWLHLITKTIAFAWLRKKRLTMESLELLPERLAPECDEPEERHNVEEAKARLWRAVDRLPRPERLVLIAHYHDELSWDEVAHKLGVCLRTVKFHAMRGILLLRAILLAEMAR
jgi:RNA polymerase sigma factor (sigma-70 family)